MPNRSAIFVLFLMTAPVRAQDSRPFGRYLVEICTQATDDLGNQRVSCGRAAPVAGGGNAKTQSIELKLVHDPASKGDGPPAYPLTAGSDFFVSATADSGLPVVQRVLSGPCAPAGGTGTVKYHASGEGTIVIRATRSASPPSTAAPPVDLILQVASKDEAAGAGCKVLGPAAPGQSNPIDLPGIVSLMGNPTPFVLTAQGSSTILIYSTRQPLNAEEQTILDSFQNTMGALVGQNAAALGIAPAPGKFTVQLSIPHAAALGDLATRIAALNYSQFSAQDVGGDQVRITAASTPGCGAWTAFLSDIRRMEWNLISEPMSARLFYLSSADVATAYGNLAGTPSAPAAASAAPAAAPPASAAAASPNASVSVSQPPGSVVQIRSDTTPCVVAGLNSGNPGACGPAAPAAGSSTPAASAAPAAKAPLGMSSLATAMAGGTQTPPDLLVFSDANAGDDAQIAERKRVLAQLDLPRPEMIINAWVMQNSSTNSSAMGSFSGMVKDLVAEYNREMEDVVLKGWEKVKELSSGEKYFNQAFHSYVAGRFVADTFSKPSPGASPQSLAQAFLDSSPANMTDPPDGKRGGVGLCERGRYCLGYNSLFNPLKPRLTDLLLTIVAAENPIDVANRSVEAVQGTAPGSVVAVSCSGETRERCNAILKNLDLTNESGMSGTCATRDQLGILQAVLSDKKARVYLECFAEAANKFLGKGDEKGKPPFGAGLMRAAVADFLFNYKMSQQYPHEFGFYDLSQSADTLNSELSPLIDAFNRDLTAFQTFLRADVQYRVERINSEHGQCCLKKLFGLDKNSFFNDGLVTVRTISGQWTYTNATSQSFLNASSAPQLSALLNSLTGANPNASGAGSLLNAVSDGNPLKRMESLAGALQNYQTTFAQIGRSLQFSAIPRSLSTASSAEIAVTLNADESAGGPTYTGGGQNDPAINTSRVANHDTSTRVRVDSVKLFEISSFSAIVERSKRRFPLLPPFVEIPYIGTLIGYPLSAAKEFHSSTAILSAVVVPTSADIAFGLRFVFDLVVDGEPGDCSYIKGADGKKACLFRKALSLKDLNREPVTAFNKKMVGCLAMATSKSECEKLSFDDLPRDK
jgi:hypothetical protein